MALKEVVKGICETSRCKYDVYTKEKTDELLESKANVSDISGKANASDVYTKTETNNLLSSKPNTSDVYMKSNITSGTIDPSGGNNGDIYLKYS